MDDKTLENELKALARNNNAQIYEINPREIMVREWVRWRCKFGCKGFAKHLGCPPYVPGPSETRDLLKEYTKAYIVHFRGIPGMGDIDPKSIPEDWHPFLNGLIRWIGDTVYELEQHAFYAGYYKSLAFAAYPCITATSVLLSGQRALRISRSSGHVSTLRECEPQWR